MAVDRTKQETGGLVRRKEHKLSDDDHDACDVEANTGVVGKRHPPDSEVIQERV